MAIHFPHAAREARPQVRSALTTLADLHQQLHPTSERAALATGFHLLDEELSGGIRPGEVVLLGGKPGIGKTIASLQWARSMANSGVVAVFACFEHDEITLLARLLSCELGEMIAASPRGSRLVQEELRERIRDVASGAITLRDALTSDPLLAEAHRRLAQYADRLVLVTGAGANSTITAIAEITEAYEGHPVALFVDYVQKVSVSPTDAPGANGAGEAVERLKQLALDRQLAVVAVAAADHTGLGARRVYARHLRGSTTLAYEADAIVMLNEKRAVYSRLPGVESPLRSRTRGRHVVFSVEKNRSGTPGVHLEFEKDFAHYRFHPHGRRLTESLWSEQGDEA